MKVNNDDNNLKNNVRDVVKAGNVSFPMYISGLPGMFQIFYFVISATITKSMIISSIY